ncbi:FG-GAP repeat domain-containing protein [Ideonella sp. YS5]|uniref:FG-GAP repeat domain-containing protein n=1 Tax=Ideonella sp. YS5 TaxID=3453714 RepID=UPI003EEF1273
MLKNWMAALLMTTAAGAQAQYQAQYLETTQDWGSVVADFDGDGHDDLYITGHDENDRIWYWTPTGYVPSAFVFPPSDRHDCDAADFDRDGLLDIYCAVGANQGTGKGYNELWIQAEGGTFYKMLDHGAEDPYGRGRLPVFLDVNHDGYPDVYVTNEATDRTDGQPNINHLFINQAGAGFAEAPSLATGARGFACAVKGDINHDGWDDLVVCNTEGRSHLYINNRGGDFKRLTATPSLDVTWRDAKLVDMDGDGWDDLVVLNNQNTVQVWLNTHHSPFYETANFSTKLVVQAVKITVGDFNRDGFKDVYVVLQKRDCKDSYHDAAPDVVFKGHPGPSWTKLTLAQDYGGCGHLADTVDGSKILLMNGGYAYRGPNYLIESIE